MTHQLGDGEIDITLVAYVRVQEKVVKVVELRFRNANSILETRMVVQGF